MREILRPLAAALGLAAMMALLSSSGVFAQAKQAPKQAPAPAAKQHAAPLLVEDERSPDQVSAGDTVDRHADRHG